MNATNGSIFHDFVPFNIQQDLANLFLGFLFNFLRNSSLKTYGPQTFVAKFEKIKKNQIFLKEIILSIAESEFYMFSPFF